MIELDPTPILYFLVIVGVLIFLGSVLKKEDES
jgi:hypothetical protein